MKTEKPSTLHRIMHAMTTAAIGLMAVAHAAAVSAAEPLVTADWVAQNHDAPGVVVLDIRSRTGGASIETYRAGHIPGAIYSNYATAGWRAKNAEGVVGMLPSEEALEALIGGLGVSNDDHVVIVTSGGSALDMGSATRVYWTFKVAGHEDVSILNGGMQAYLAERDPTTKKPTRPLATGGASRAATDYDATIDRGLIADRSDVDAAIATNATALIDHRPDHHYLGLTKPGPVRSPGTLPGALNVPESWLTKNGGGVFRNKSDIEKLFDAAGAPKEGDVIGFCNTGHWASLGWFATSEILGNKDAKLYDGSMTEWTRDPSRPVERKIAVE